MLQLTQSASPVRIPQDAGIVRHVAAFDNSKIGVGTKFVVQSLIEDLVEIEVDDGVDEPMLEEVCKDLGRKRRIVAPAEETG